MKNNLRRFIQKPALGTVFIMTACTWVETTDQGASVTLVSTEEAKDCERLGTTTVSVKDSLGFLERDQGKVAIELQTLAQNYAAAQGGDGIAASGLPVDGVQEFTIYNCGS